MEQPFPPPVSASLCYLLVHCNSKFSSLKRNEFGPYLGGQIKISLRFSTGCTAEGFLLPMHHISKKLSIRAYSCIVPVSVCT